jgi:uncharacterized glyoxalase superfamily protein PhnB
MKLKRLTPMLCTQNLPESIDFYTGILGFTCTGRNDELGWAALQKDAVEIMLALPNAHSTFKNPAFTGSLYMRTDDVDALWVQLKDKTKVRYPIETFSWNMREFAIFDNNGYTLQFGQEMPAAEGAA